MRNDAVSHDGAEHDDIPEVLGHELVPADPPVLVKDQPGLAALLKDLRDAGSFGYDSEFIGERTYYPKLCLIQVGLADRIVLIDAMAGLDLTDFWRLVADPGVEKIVHAGQQDLEPVVRHLGAAPANIFDTQVAAGFIGLDYPLSLARLVEQRLDADLGRGAKFSQWDRRPLTEVQMAYAANDVRYLPLLRRSIGEALEPLNNTAYAVAACAELCDPGLYENDPMQRRIRVRGIRSLKPKQLAVLNTLRRWREDIAREEDLPPRAMIPDQSLFDLACTPITGPSQLARIKGLPSPVRKTYGQQIVGVIARALEGPPADPPKRYAPLTDSQKAVVADRWAAVQRRCEERRIAPGAATSKAEVSRYCLSMVKHGRPPRDSKLAAGWRAEVLADVLDAAAETQ